MRLRDLGRTIVSLLPMRRVVDQTCRHARFRVLKPKAKYHHECKGESVQDKSLRTGRFGRLQCRGQLEMRHHCRALSPRSRRSVGRESRACARQESGSYHPSPKLRWQNERTESQYSPISVCVQVRSKGRSSNGMS